MKRAKEWAVRSEPQSHRAAVERLRKAYRQLVKFADEDASQEREKSRQAKEEVQK